MKLYIAITLIGSAAMAFIAAHPPSATAPAAALALAGAASTALARQAEGHWLFRPMPAGREVQTLTTVPNDARAQLRSL